MVEVIHHNTEELYERVTLGRLRATDLETNKENYPFFCSNPVRKRTVDSAVAIKAF